MKIKILALFFSLFFFTTLCQAQSTIEYRPEWQLGNVVRYEISAKTLMDIPAYPLHPLLENRLIEFKAVTRHEVISRSEDAVEFRMTLENIEIPDSLMNDILPNWRERLSKPLGISWKTIENIVYQNFEISYKITPQGEFIEFTHPESHQKLLNALSEATSGKIPSSRFQKELPELKTFFETDSAYQSLLHAQILSLPPHPAPYMGHTYPVGTSKSQLSQKSPAIPKVTKEEITFSLTGTSNAVKNGDDWVINLDYPFTEKEMTQLFDDFIPQIIWPNENSKQEAKAIWKEWKKKKPLSLNGVSQFSLEFAENGSSLNYMHLYSHMKGNLAPNKLPRVSTAAKEPVPFEITSWMTVIKLSEEPIGQKGEMDHEKN